MKIKNNIEFLSFSASAAVVALFLANGVVPQTNPIKPNEYIVAREALTVDDWKSLMHHPEFVYLGIVYLFATSGATITLPTDFDVTNNTIYCIGAGKAGGPGSDATFCLPPSCAGGGGGCAGGCGTWNDGRGGQGGGGGACAEIVNYALHAAGQGVPIQVGANASWFHSSSTVFAAGAGSFGNQGQSDAVGGQASNCIGTTKISGQNNGGATGSTGGKGGNAGGPTTFGINPGAGTGGNGGVGGNPHGTVGSNGGQYGAGGGGGGGGTGISGLGAAGGSGYQGLIAVAYTPIPGGIYYFFSSAF